MAAPNVTTEYFPMWMPRGFVLSSFALPEIAVPSPMSIFQIRIRYCRRTESTTSRNESRIRVARGTGIVDHDAFYQRPEESDAFEHLALRPGGRELHLCRERAVELLGVRDVADAVDVRVFLVRRALTLGELGQVGHELADEALEERHGDRDGHGIEPPDELTDAHQVVVDGLRVRVGGHRVGRDGEATHHPRMTVPHFLAQVVDDLGAGLIRSRREQRGGHPVDEVAL